MKCAASAGGTLRHFIGAQRAVNLMVGWAIMYLTKAHVGNVLPFPPLHQAVRERAHVQPINQFLIFELGAKVRAVTVLPEQPTLSQAAGPLFSLQTTLSELLGGKPIQLDFSLGAVR